MYIVQMEIVGAGLKLREIAYDSFPRLSKVYVL